MTRTDAAAAVDAAIAYHDRTKHDFNRYALSPGYLDWANQPDPFRRYAGAPLFLLPFAEEDPTPPYDALYKEPIEAQPLTVSTLGVFFENSLAISASKEYQGTGWKLRCNPSSGNLHPTEGYAVLGPIDGLSESAGVYHYAPNEHGLEQRGAFSAQTWAALTQCFPKRTFFAGLTSVYWREAWKYGERALRYCHHDAGHALGALRLSAAALGWRCVLLDALSDEAVATLLGVDREEDYAEADREHPDLILAVITTGGDQEIPNALEQDAIRAVAESPWTGTANALSEEHVNWSIIPDTSAACAKPWTKVTRRPLQAFQSRESHPAHNNTPLSAGAIFEQRRSAVAMDGTTGLSAGAFYLMLERTMPRKARPPFDAWPYPSMIHLAIFVHRVEGLTPGLYLLVRNGAHEHTLRDAMQSNFVWTTPPGCPPELPLYLLGEGDCRRLAAQVSCLQDIAGYGAFSLGMIATFEQPLREYGAWYYPRLFWEAGLIGQVLYDEAEAAGVRSTGIGCYFDDPVHRVLGLSSHAFQSLYHFTVGGAVDDPRLTQRPPYDAERRAQRGWM